MIHDTSMPTGMFVTKLGIQASPPRDHFSEIKYLKEIVLAVRLVMGQVCRSGFGRLSLLIGRKERSENILDAKFGFYAKKCPRHVIFIRFDPVVGLLCGDREARS